LERAKSIVIDEASPEAKDDEEELDQEAEQDKLDLSENQN
jgi:hypothetical protein